MMSQFNMEKESLVAQNKKIDKVFQKMLESIDEVIIELKNFIEETNMNEISDKANSMLEEIQQKFDFLNEYSGNNINHQ